MSIFADNKNERVLNLEYVHTASTDEKRMNIVFFYVFHLTLLNMMEVASKWGTHHNQYYYKASDLRVRKVSLIFEYF